jgi:hypothetical protein
VPMFETRSGRRLELDLPRTEWKELEEVRDDYEALKKERRVTETRLRSLRGERERAVFADRAALADAIREGKPESTGTKVEKIEKEIVACEHRLEALELALDDAEDDLLAQVDEHRDEWGSDVETGLEAAREQYAEAVESLAAARAKVSAHYALLRWVRLFPEEEMGYQVRSSYVRDLKAPHGEPYLFDVVVQSLRDDAQARPEVERTISETQLRHEAKLANVKAGRGYFTDEELVRLEQNPEEFWGGQGARVLKSFDLRNRS